MTLLTLYLNLKLEGKKIVNHSSIILLKQVLYKN